MQRHELLDFVQGRERAILATTRRDGRPQMSPVAAGVDDNGRIVISTYAARDKAHNVRRNPKVSVLFLSDDWDGPWVSIDGQAELIEGEAGVEALVEYYRVMRGSHPDWDEYRAKMREGNKALIRITPERSSPISQGGPYVPKGTGWQA